MRKRMSAALMGPVLCVLVAACTPGWCRFDYGKNQCADDEILPRDMRGPSTSSDADAATPSDMLNCGGDGCTITGISSSITISPGEDAFYHFKSSLQRWGAAGINGDYIMIIRNGSGENGAFGWRKVSELHTNTKGTNVNDFSCKFLKGNQYVVSIMMEGSRPIDVMNVSTLNLQITQSPDMNGPCFLDGG